MDKNNTTPEQIIVKGPASESVNDRNARLTEQYIIRPDAESGRPDDITRIESLKEQLSNPSSQQVSKIEEVAVNAPQRGSSDTLRDKYEALGRQSMNNPSREALVENGLRMEAQSIKEKSVRGIAATGSGFVLGLTGILAVDATATAAGTSFVSAIPTFLASNTASGIILGLSATVGPALMIGGVLYTVYQVPKIFSHYLNKRKISKTDTSSSTLIAA